MKMLIHNSLIFQLDCELTRHWSEVSEFMDIASKWIDRWSKKEQLKELKKENHSLSMDLRELNKLKLQLSDPS